MPAEAPEQPPPGTLELYLPYVPLPGGGGGLPAVSSAVASCRPVLLGGVDLSMSAAVQQPAGGPGPAAQLPPPPELLAMPALGGPPLMMPRAPQPPAALLEHQPADAAAADGPPNPDVLLALLARNKKLEGRCRPTQS